MTQEKEILAKLDAITELLTVVKPPPMDLGEAATYLHVSKQTLYRMTSKSEIPHFKPSGKKVYFLRRDLDAWLTRNRVRPRGEEV